MRVLVTGGAGFIGTHLVYALHAGGNDVTVLDLLTYAGCRENLADLQGGPRYRFVQGDIADGDLVDGLLAQGFDAVVNAAAETHVDRSLHDPSAFLRTNVLGTQVLLDAARRHGTGRFVQVSTDEVYGDLGEGDPPFTEAHPLRPSSPYAASKAAADLLVLAAFRTFGQPVLVSRCSNNYGPFQFPEKFVPTVIHRALAGQDVPIYGTGDNVRDWIHVVDHCRGLLAVLLRGRPGETYNLGGACEVRNLDLARALLRELGRADDLLRFVADRQGHDRRYAMDFRKASGELGFTPSVPFRQGIRDTVAWYRDHPEIGRAHV